jgi:NADP-dependent 3-hydroxy acid dehydrogenase YdfG
MSPTPRLAGTVALVTGASSGIGAATAVTLSAEGAAVSLVARRKDRLEELAQRIRAEGGTALVLEADVTEEQQAVDAVARTVTEFGRLDTLINNAGVMLLGPIVLQAAEEGPRQVADMVNVSSVAGRVARTGNGVYSLTKHGVGAFSEALRQEVTRRHVRVSLMEPGATSTELVTHNRPEVIDGLRGQISNAEPMKAEDIADAITYIVTRPRHVAISEMLIRPTEQER